MKKAEVRTVLNKFGYQFLDQIYNDVSKILDELPQYKNRKTNISLDTFLHALDDELNDRDMEDLNYGRY